ncbi:GNAT family N-acetyltransferase [Bacillus solimangrovi]|uniref:GNAT family N-acetyltransferase n=1 Tax=Bacillus solimangrovi TaxID=1305675 RepID=A0A1E5LGC6_9BACI|nr:GNAT family N-acetyltransferase [Bacillus solimangrovi]OEH93130.1 GNAT family N-acetyltransferase [Bacillus solimangrovi]
MEQFETSKITNLLINEIDPLVHESKEDGFRFVERLVNDYTKGTNKFNKKGEALYGVYNQSNELVAVGGININPFTNDPNVGRLRRFYVKKAYRRNGVGSLLLKTIISNAKSSFNVVVLNTTEQADKFYTSHGFSKDTQYENTTHYMYLKKQ